MFGTEDEGTIIGLRHNVENNYQTQCDDFLMSDSKKKCIYIKLNLYQKCQNWNLGLLLQAKTKKQSHQ
jgi:hypothetical protein